MLISMTQLQSETLKYLFLLFSDGDTIPLSSEYEYFFRCLACGQYLIGVFLLEYVFNTEVRRGPIVHCRSSIREAN